MHVCLHLAGGFAGSTTLTGLRCFLQLFWRSEHQSVISSTSTTYVYISKCIKKERTKERTKERKESRAGWRNLKEEEPPRKLNVRTALKSASSCANYHGRRLSLEAAFSISRRLNFISLASVGGRLAIAACDGTLDQDYSVSCMHNSDSRSII